MRKLLLTGAGLMVASLLLALLLPQALQFQDAPLTDGQLVALTVGGWLQQAALVLGAVLVGAAVVLRHLLPPDEAAPGRLEPGVDWYA